MAQISSTIGLLSGLFISSIGTLYILSPTRAAQGLGLPIPQPVDQAERWFRIKGIRDVVSGLLLITSISYGPRRLAGGMMVLGSIIAFGDAWVVWAAARASVPGEGGTGKAGPHFGTGLVVLLAGLHLGLGAE